VFCLAANIGGKSAIAIMMEESLSAANNWDASQWIKSHVAGLIKGGGGGQKTFANAGGQDASRLAEAVQAIRGLL
jgi:alanyl-tRNA synthetase